MVDKFLSSKEKKAEILRLASTGADKPTIRKKHPLAYSLSCYVAPSKDCYDPDFKEKLQELRPDWFFGSQSRDKKMALLNLAIAGESRPPKKHLLAKAFTNYISPSSNVYDPEFKNKLQELRPDWFSQQKDVEGKKTALLELAASGAAKPLYRRHPLGHNLESYTHQSSNCYDPEFKNKLQELRPDWFSRRRDPQAKKTALLELAASGAKKPVRNKQLPGNHLKIFTDQNSKSFDPEFTSKLQKLRPDWFSQQKDVEGKKTALLELAASGAAKPLPKKHPLGHNLESYVNQSSHSYDPEFKNKLQELRPDWFSQQKDVEGKKIALLELAASGAAKPLPRKHPLGHSLAGYVSHSSKCFDPEFKDKLQELRPDWFQRNQDPEAKKTALLELAASGAKKPVRNKQLLGHHLKIFIDQNSKSFDPEFTSKLRKLRPDWFQNKQ